MWISVRRTSPVARALVVARLRPEDGTRRVEPPVVLPLDLQHVGVLGHRLERVEALDLDAVHRRLPAQQRARGVEAGSSAYAVGSVKTRPASSIVSSVINCPPRNPRLGR